MRQLESFMSSLLPNFEISRVTKSVDQTTVEFSEVVTPAFESVLSAFSANKKDFKFVSSVENTLLRELAKKPRNGTLLAVAEILKDAPSKGVLLKKLIEEHYNQHVTVEGMTYARANVLKLTEVYQFVAEFSRRLLLTTVNYLNEDLVDVDTEKLLKREVAWLTKGAEAYVASLNIMAMKDSDLESKIKNIPDLAIIAGRISETADTVGHDKIDPIQVGLIPHRWNPIFYARIAIVEWQEARLRKAKMEKQQLELLLIALKSKEATPKMRQQIKYYEDEIVLLGNKIKRMEDV